MATIGRLLRRPHPTPRTPQPCVIAECSLLTGAPLRWWRGRDWDDWTRYPDKAHRFDHPEHAHLAIYEWCLEDRYFPKVVSL